MNTMQSETNRRFTMTLVSKYIRAPSEMTMPNTLIGFQSSRYNSTLTGTRTAIMITTATRDVHTGRRISQTETFKTFQKKNPLMMNIMKLDMHQEYTA